MLETSVDSFIAITISALVILLINFFVTLAFGLLDRA